MIEIQSHSELNHTQTQPAEPFAPGDAGARRSDQARIAELIVLQRIGQELNATLDERQILNLLIEETVAVTGATHGSVILQNKARDIWQPQAWYGYTPDQLHALADLGRSRQRGIIHRVFASGRPAVIDDVHQETGYVEIVPTTRSELTVPIHYGNEVVGVIDLESSDQGAFGPDNQRFLLAVAEQAAIAIGNARRYAEQVERENAASLRTEQLRNLLEISRMLRTGHNLEDVLDLVVQSIPVAAGFNVALLSLVEGDPATLRRVAAAGIPLSELQTLQQERQPLSALLNLLQERYHISDSYFFPHQERDLWDDQYTHAVLPDRPDWREGEWHPSDMLLVPLRDSNGELLGLISVDDPQNGLTPNQKTIEALELFAHEAALAIENARLLGEAQQHVDELELLRQVGLQVASSLDLSTVLDTIVDSALRLVPASDVRIYLYDQQTGRFAFGTQKSRHGGLVRPMSVPRPDGFTAQVVRRGEMMVINQAQNHELYNRPESKDWGMRAIAGFPLKRAAEILGVMDVSFFYEHTLTAKELNLLSMLANQVAIAIDNAHQYEQAKKRASYLESLWYINQQLASILDLNELLSRVVEIVQARFRYEQIYIYLLDHEQQQLKLQATRSADQAAPDGEIPLDRPRCIISWVATHNEPLLIRDAENGHDSLPFPRLTDSPQPRCELAVPLHLGDQVVGVLDIRSPQAHALTRDDLWIIQSLAAQLDVVLQNARLYDELELRVQKRTEELAEALRRQALEADKTRAIVESISDGVIVFDPQGQVILANPAVERVLGIPAQAWLRHNLNEYPASAPDARPDMKTAVWNAVRSAQKQLSGDQDLVSASLSADGRVVAVSFTSVALREQEPPHVVAVFRDITREVQLDRMKSEFIAMAAHELRTPMTSIKGYISLLSAGLPGPVNEKQREFLQVTNSNADRMMTLVNDLLDLSKIESEGLRLNLEPVSLADVVAAVVFTMQNQIKTKEQTLTVDVPLDLPEINADRDRLIQVVTNLLSNAHKYTPTGGAIGVRGRREPGRLVLEVQDSGIGIAPQDQERLFTRFFRADNAIETQVGGTGLGLAICREIAQRHHGDIVVQSELGRGSTFQVILPLVSD